MRLPLIVAEQCALRVEGLVGLVWGRIDERGCNLLVAEKGRKARWTPVPEWLMAVIGVMPDDEIPESVLRELLGACGDGTRAANHRKPAPSLKRG
jgi:integrase